MGKPQARGSLRGALCDLLTSRTWASAQECGPLRVPGLLSFPSPSGKHFVPLTFAPFHSPTYLSGRTCWPDPVPALGNARPLGLGDPQSTPSLAPSSCLCNADPPSPETLLHPRPHYSALNSGGGRGGVPSSDNYSGQVDT